jgi:hypothetical protein
MTVTEFALQKQVRKRNDAYKCPPVQLSREMMRMRTYSCTVCAHCAQVQKESVYRRLSNERRYSEQAEAEVKRSGSTIDISSIAEMEEDQEQQAWERQQVQWEKQGQQ